MCPSCTNFPALNSGSAAPISVWKHPDGITMNLEPVFEVCFEVYMLVWGMPGMHKSPLSPWAPLALGKDIWSQVHTCKFIPCLLEVIWVLLTSAMRVDVLFEVGETGHMPYTSLSFPSLPAYSFALERAQIHSNILWVSPYVWIFSQISFLRAEGAQEERGNLCIPDMPQTSTYTQNTPQIQILNS